MFLFQYLRHLLILLVVHTLQIISALVAFTMFVVIAPIIQLYKQDGILWASTYIAKFPKKLIKP